MPLTKEKAKQNLSCLLAKFERELAAHKIREYNEEAAKTAFIQPFLKEVLGWDVNDRDEVSPEEKISRGRVDYGLKVEGKTKIFVEAKPPRAELSRHIDQAVRYGYNRKGVPFVLLTDFEAIKLFDVTVKPDIRNPLKGLKLDLERSQYLNNFDQLWQLSRESVASGKLDELLRVKPKERLPVDKAILEDLKRWREILAKDIFKNNPELFHSGESEKDANYLKEITQKILDRIIFMRSCEDRALYHGRSLKEIFDERTDTVGTGTMVFLKKEFENYNIYFDSDLFSPREWEAKLDVDFKVMQGIILDTYNPYQFDVIPLEVLGNIYEQYLGYTIRLTEHQVKYELKPEVRKAGGVYYTPEYIVDYVVKNTVGKMLHELSENKAKRLKILDPACGSGSFLIRAYEEMLKYYQEQKTNRIKPREGEKKLGLPEEKLRLSIDEKRNILIQHIFGVDIDDQAVEITKLSLMLKMLDGEHGIPAGRGILPMLDKNIRCGNSLISGNALELHKYFGEDWYMVKPFNWEDEFHQIMKDEGGFGAVIGNPPWGQKADIIADNVKGYIRDCYKSVSGIFDNFRPFVERGIGLMRVGGIFGMILPDILLLKDYPTTREYILDAIKIFNIDFWNMPFEQVNLDAVTIIGLRETNGRARNESSIGIHVRDKQYAIDFENILKQRIFLENTGYKFNLFFKPEILRILQKLKAFTRYGILFETHEGVHSGNIREKLFISSMKNRYCRRLIFGREELRRYLLNWAGLWVNYDQGIIDRQRNEYANLGHREYFETPKIVIRRTGDRIVSTYDSDGFYFSNNAFISLPIEKISLKYVLGILNSKLLTWFYRAIQPRKGRLFAELKINHINEFPIRRPSRRDSSERDTEDKMINLVDIMLDLNKKIQTAKGAEKDQIQRQIEKTDLEIDALVYELYGITEEERRIIEGE